MLADVQRSQGCDGSLRCERWIQCCRCWRAQAASVCTCLAADWPVTWGEVCLPALMAEREALCDGRVWSAPVWCSATVAGGCVRIAARRARRTCWPWRARSGQLDAAMLPLGGGRFVPRPCLIFWPLAHARRRRRGAPMKHLGGSLFPCPTQPACSPACQRVYLWLSAEGGMMHPARMQLPFPITGPPTAQFSPVQASAAQFAAVAAPSAAVAALPSPGAGADARPVLTHDSCHALARDVL